MFFVQEIVASIQLQTISQTINIIIPTTNEQIMKSKLCTFAHNQILHKPIDKLVKN